MSEVRRTTRCAGCKETFSYRFNITPNEGDNLIVRTSCPFCKKKLRIDLNPYFTPKVVSYKGWDETEDEAVATLDLPDELSSELAN
jgi:hypothetical protein